MSEISPQLPPQETATQEGMRLFLAQIENLAMESPEVINAEGVRWLKEFVPKAVGVFAELYKRFAVLPADQEKVKNLLSHDRGVFVQQFVDACVDFEKGNIIGHQLGWDAAVQDEDVQKAIPLLQKIDQAGLLFAEPPAQNP